VRHRAEVDPHELAVTGGARAPGSPCRRRRRSPAYHLRALRELPADVIIPPQLVVSIKTAEHLADRLAKPRKPTPAMRALFSKKK
jgi:hypothetical protein